MSRRTYAVTETVFLQLIERVLREQASDRIELLSAARERRLTSRTREELREMLADELVRNGLTADSEPNAHGRLVEAAIDWLSSR